jgi:hypothetical protein
MAKIGIPPVGRDTYFRRFGRPTGGRNGTIEFTLKLVAAQV